MDLMYQSIEHFEVLKGNGIAGVTLQEEKIVVWPNVDQSTLNRKNVAKSLGIKSVVGIPIFYNNEVIAIFAFFSKTELQPSLVNNNLLNAISHQIGAYIQKNKSENELNMFFNISPDLICIAGYDGYFKKINGSVSKFLNYPNEKLLGEPLINFVHPDDREQTLNIRKNIMKRIKIY
jgi:PAS domain-containing protein